MILYFAKNTTLDKIDLLITQLPKHSTLIVSFKTIEIDLIEELNSSEGGLIKKFAKLSEEYKISVIIGHSSKVYGSRYQSVLVINEGVIMGMSDMTHSIYSRNAITNSIKVYEFKNEQVGIVVGDDIFVPELIRKIGSLRTNYIIHIHNLKTTSTIAVVTAEAIFGGGTIFSLSDGELVIANGRAGSALVDNNDMTIVDTSKIKSTMRPLALREQVLYNISIIGLK